MVTLFVEMILSNWWVVVDMTAAYSENYGTGVVRAYFIIFLIICVYMVLNIIVAIVLEIHTSHEDKSQLKFATINAKKKLHAMLHDDNKQEMRRKLEEARQVVEELEKEVAELENDIGSNN